MKRWSPACWAVLVGLVVGAGPVAVLSSAARAATGAGVVVDEATTPFQQVVLNADGTRTATISSVPVRVKSGTGWVPIDTSLMVNADGSVSPRAVLSPLRLSGGGNSEMAQMNRGGVGLAWTFPVSLPKPTLSGDTAVYAGVWPGVDLQVTAQPEGFSEVLKVASADAARSITSISLGVKASGGSMSGDATGGIAVRNASGQVVMASPRAAMWDSKGVGVASAGVSADGQRVAGHGKGPASGDATSALAESVTSSGVTLTPPSSMLGAGATWPVFVDPAVYGPGPSSWAMVDKAFPTTSYYKWTDADQGVGFSDFQSPTHTKRLLFAFPTAAVAGTHIISAQFSDTETWSSSCNPRAVELWQTGAFGGSTWNVQPAWSSKQSSATVAYGNPACGTSTGVSPNPTLVEFSATTAVTSLAAAKAGTGYFGLRASETDDLAWKRFKSTAKLTINYDHAPALPTNAALTAGGVKGCGSSAAPTKINSSFTLAASMTDADTGDQLTGDFRYWSASTGTLIAVRDVGPHAQGSFVTPSLGLPNTATYGATYYWQAYATDPSGLASPTTARCYFMIDTTAPGAPKVTASVKGAAAVSPPADGSSLVVQQSDQLTFTFTPQGVVADTVKYRWAINGDTPNSTYLPSSTATAGGVTVSTSPVTLSSAGESVLRVWAYDSAGNSSGSAVFPLSVTAAQPARWALDDTVGPSTYDRACATSGSGPAVTDLTWTGAGVSSVPGHAVSALASDKALGFANGMAYTSGIAPIATQAADPQTANGTVVAWVHVGSAAVDGSTPAKLVGGTKTLLSVNAGQSAVSLALTADADGAARFTASVPGTIDKAVSITSVQDVTDDVIAGGWYRVALTIDYAHDDFELVVMYDDPATGFAQPVITAPDWSTGKLALSAMSGALRLGSAPPTTGTTPVNPWVGDVDEVLAVRAAFPSTVSGPSQMLVQWLYAGPSPAGHTAAATPCH